MAEGAGWLPGAHYKGINHILKGWPLMNSSLPQGLPPNTLSESEGVKITTQEVYWDTLIFFRIE